MMSKGQFVRLRFGRFRLDSGCSAFDKGCSALLINSKLTGAFSDSWNGVSFAIGGMESLKRLPVVSGIVSVDL
jgi:hypothetical protein